MASAEAAEALVNTDAATWIDALQRAFFDVSLIAAGGPPRYFPGQAAALTRVAEFSSRPQLAALLKWLNDQRRVAGHPLSARLFAQAVLQRCAQACTSNPVTKSLSG